MTLDFSNLKVFLGNHWKPKSPRYFILLLFKLYLKKGESKAHYPHIYLSSLFNLYLSTLISIWLSIYLYIFFSIIDNHFCMPRPLAPDPIRVQSCVCCFFWTNRNSMVVTSIFLSISLYNQKYESFNQHYQEIFTSTETIVNVWCFKLFLSSLKNRILKI